MPVGGGAAFENGGLEGDGETLKLLDDIGCIFRCNNKKTKCC